MGYASLGRVISSWGYDQQRQLLNATFSLIHRTHSAVPAGCNVTSLAVVASYPSVKLIQITLNIWLASQTPICLRLFHYTQLS